MATRKFILVAGADNAADIADPRLFETEMPFLALRDPDTTSGQTADAEEFSPPGDFPGGPVLNPDGSVVAGSFDTVDLRGRAVGNLRFLTRFNKSADGLDVFDNEAGSLEIVEVISQRHLVTQPKLNPSIPPLIIVADVTSGVFAFAIGGLNVGDEVVFVLDNEDALPPNNIIDFGAVYYISEVVAANNYRVSETLGGPSIEPEDFGANIISVYEPTETIVTRDLLGTGLTTYVDINGDLRLGSPVSPAIEEEETLSFVFEFASGVGSGDITRVIPNVVPGTRIEEVTSVTAQLTANYSLQALLRLDGHPAVYNQPVKLRALNGTLPPELDENTTYYLTPRTPPGPVTLKQPSPGTDAFTSWELVGASEQPFYNGDRVRFRDPVPDPVFPSLKTLTSDTDVYTLVEPLVQSPNEVIIAWAFDNSAINFNAIGSTQYTVDIQGVENDYNLSTAVNGDPIEFATSIDPALVLEVTLEDIQRGHYSGYRIEFSGGSVDGAVRKLVNVTRDALGVGIVLDESLPAGSTWDSAQVFPPEQNDVTVDLDRYSLFLPWSPFEGYHDYGKWEDAELVEQADPGGPVELRVTDAVSKGFAVGRTVVISENYRNSELEMAQADVVTGSLRVGNTVENTFFRQGDRVRFIDSGGLPTGLSTVQVYTVLADGLEEREFRVAASVNGSAVIPSTQGTIGLWSVQLLTPRNFPGGFWARERLYVVGIDGDDMMLSRVQNGPPITETSGYVAESTLPVRAQIADHLDRTNPYPPGFNYPSSQAIPTDYEVFDGYSPKSRAKIGIAVPLAYRFSANLGEDIYVVNVAFPDSSVGGRSVVPSPIPEKEVGWFDPEENLSWTITSAGSAYYQLLNALSSARAAFRAQGDEGECVGVFWLGGDVDADYDLLTDIFYDSMKSLRQQIRKRLFDEGFVSGDWQRVPFIFSTIADDDTGNRATINKVFAQLAREDVWTRTADVNDLIDIDTGAGLEPTDGSAPIPPLDP